MNSEHLFAIGATHHTAPIGIRERLSLAPESDAGLACELAALPGLREFAIVNTCNRVEIYGVADEPAVMARVEAAYCSRQRFDPAEFGKFRLGLTGLEAVQHLLEVASGLDSQMLGENEIFGQVKKAYTVAQERGSAGPVLNRLFQKAFQAAKQARTQTAISQGQVSVANVAVNLALTIFDSLADVRILLVGAGEIGEKSARAFQSRGATALTVASRRLERASALAAGLGGNAIPFDECEARLSEFDVIVCSTSATGTVISERAVAAATARRPNRPIFLIDLAMPRDVEASVTKISNAFLYNLDDLARIAEENRTARHAEIVKCKGLLVERAGALWRQLESQLAKRQQESVAGQLREARGSAALIGGAIRLAS